MGRQHSKREAPSGRDIGAALRGPPPPVWLDDIGRTSERIVGGSQKEVPTCAFSAIPKASSVWRPDEGR